MMPTMSGAPGPVDALGLVGTTVDQVRFDACVDMGGFGLIYRGHHLGLGETVAIKCLRIAAMQKTNEELREALAGRFRDETKLLYRLSQGNLDIVRCIGSGTLVAPRTKEYTPYMVLEWLEGSTLSVELKERRQQGLAGRTLEAAVALLDPAAGGLAYAHAHDVVHRDVKPGNLFLTETREGVRMKVLDFGLAKILSDESIGVRPSVETGIGVHFCSPSYGAPEQFSARAGKIGPWTDVYSLTLVLLEIMTGDKVRHATSLADGLLKALDAKTGSPSASSLGLRLPKAVEELLERAVAQDPNERPRDVGVFWAALKNAIASARPNVNMATVMDDSVGDAMLQVRAAVAGASQRPAPFAGTMLMRNAPAGAPHLDAGPVSLLPSVPAAPLPAAGRPPEGASGAGPQPTPPPLVSRSTSPLGGSPSAAPPASPESRIAAQERLKGTLPMGALSPLAASLAVASPRQNVPSTAPGPGPQHAQQQQHAQPQQHAQSPYGSQPPHSQPPHSQPPPQPYARAKPPPDLVRTGPRATPLETPAKSSAGPIVFIVACLVLAAVGITLYVIRVRGH
jgi:eukaryotic-like serine/threonine-protein kinase